MPRRSTALAALTIAAAAHATPITYQGVLDDGGAPANGTYDLRFDLADSAVAGFLLQSAVLEDVLVSDGHFTVELDFDDVHFDGSDRWIGVRVDGIILSPRQKVNSTPYAIRSNISADLEAPWFKTADTRIVDVTSNFDITMRSTTGTGPSAFEANNLGDETTVVLAAEDYAVDARNEGTPGQGTGVLGRGAHTGVVGIGVTTTEALTGDLLERTGVFGSALSNPNTRQIWLYGVRGIASCPPDAFLIARHAYGVYGEANANIDPFNEAFGVYGTASSLPGGATAWAGYFDGNVHVNGTLSKSAGSFKIDHPLDPETKYLSHSFVESPEMLNVYSGVAVLDGRGRADVALPDYFEALNDDFRYQLTPIGAPMRDLHVAREVERNTFSIAGGAPRAKVSWEVSGVRRDAAARHNPIIVEQDKAPHHHGLYLNPEAFGHDATRGIHTPPRHEQ